MKINEKFVKILDENRLDYAPAVPTVDGYLITCPTANDYLSAIGGPYKELIDVVPQDDIADGFVWVNVGYEEDERYVYVKYESKAEVHSIEDYDRAMEEHLQQEKNDRGYTTREPSDYLNSSVQRWKQDAEDWVAHRDSVMLYALSVENAALSSGSIPTLNEFKANLPKITWTYNKD